MAIDIRGISADRALRAHVNTRLTAALARLAVKPVGAQVTVFDENGPKGGPAMRCALTVRLPYRPHLRVEDTAETARLAFDGSLAKLERELERYRDRDRESQRHPKKYYTAKRLMAPEPEGAGGGSEGGSERAPARSGRGRRRA
jgi:ribosome-associated translation inhibitor RaiA